MPAPGAPSAEILRYEQRGRVGWLTIDRPEKRNALMPAFWSELRSVLARARDDAETRALVIHGAGPCFCAGGDIEGFGDLDTVAARRAYQEEALGALRAMGRSPVPTVAAVHGYALGGGCELTMVADIVVADDTAVFGLPEASVGLIPGLAVVRGRAHTSAHWLKYLTFTGERIDAETARMAGLVNVLTPRDEHLDEAGRLADAITERSPLALQVAKRIIDRGSWEDYDYSIEAVALLHGSDDQTEGVEAFRQQRAPRFEGR